MSVTVLKERLGHRCFRRPFFVEHFLVTASVQDKELAKDKWSILRDTSVH